MANYLSNIDDLVNNPATRVPICLCLDLSDSMNSVEGGEYRLTGRTEKRDGKIYNIVEGGTTRLNELQKGIEMFFSAIKEDEMAIDAAEISIVGFNNEANTLLDFNHIEKQIVPKLKAKGFTSLGKGVNLALKILEERKQLYKDNGLQYWQPWLVIMTDGDNTGSSEELNTAIDKINELTNAGKLVVFAVAIGKEANIETLARLSPKLRPLRLKGLKFKEFFTWLSKSVSRTSASQLGEKVSLPPVDVWGTLPQ